MTIFIGLIAAIIGFCIAWYIQYKQQANKPLMCTRRSPCETVLQSPQAKTFGIPNTGLGLFYYGAVFLLLTYYGAGNSVEGTPLVIFIATAGGFLFSAYLVWVQSFKIKQWCVWCLGSALISTVLFVCASMIVL